MFDAQRRINVIQCTHEVSDQPDVLLSAVLGSCIAVCAHDDVARVGGMNHILLPGDRDEGSSNQPNMYGINLMELLLNGLYAHGARKKNLQFKLFGGASMFKMGLDIGTRNVDFISQFMRDESLNVVSSSLGGKAGRRVEFHPVSGRTRQKLVSADVAEIRSARAPAPTQDSGDIELF